MFEVELLKKVRRSRARIISGPYNYVDTKEKIGIQLEDVPSVHAGRIAITTKGEKGSVSVKYNSDKYGVTKVETIDEISARHKSEIEEAHKALEIASKDSYLKGEKEGYNKGYQAGTEEVAKTVESLLEVVQATHSATKDYFVKVEDQLAEFAMTIAKSIVNDAAENYREVAVKLAGEVISEAIDKSKILLIVNPVDYETVVAARSKLKSVSEGVKDLEIESSVNVHPGGVILESKGGSIDATIETMIDEVHKALKPGFEQIDNGDVE
ncbi:MAG: FliH/SctL family protein [Candidatus Electryonea clarkiae]|nr:FliH/SctL family protein [Candidatus Electryonea clarkiae]